MAGPTSKFVLHFSDKVKSILFAELVLCGLMFFTCYVSLCRVIGKLGKLEFGLPLSKHCSDIVVIVP